MNRRVIDDYIASRYNDWLHYAKFHCGASGVGPYASDVLSEVVCDLLEKDEQFLGGLYDRVDMKSKCRELDFYVLRMLKLNATSPTSPYWRKMKAVSRDNTVELQELRIAEDVTDSDTDYDIAGKYEIVRRVFNSLELSEKSQEIFSWKFFKDNSYEEWPGPESVKYLYAVYNRILKIISVKVRGLFIF